MWRSMKQRGGAPAQERHACGVQGPSRGPPGPAECPARHGARAVVGSDTSLRSNSSFFSLFLLPALHWHQRLPLPPSVGTSATGSLSQTFLLETRTDTSLVHMLLTFSHCFWKGKQSLRLLLRRWQRTHDRGVGKVGLVPKTLPARFTRLLTACWEVGGVSIRVSGPPFPSLGFTDGGVGGAVTSSVTTSGWAERPDWVWLQWPQAGGSQCMAWLVDRRDGALDGSRVPSPALMLA